MIGCEPKEERFVTQCMLKSGPATCKHIAGFPVYEEGFQVVKTKCLCSIGSEKCSYSKIRPVSWIGETELDRERRRRKEGEL